MKKLFIFLNYFLLLFSCKKIDSDGYRIFKIKKNTHRSTLSYRTTKESKFKLKCIFDSSVIYTTEDQTNQRDVNKLWGVSDCGTNHMDNSIRFGWRWLNDSLEILWFKHLNGDFDFGVITTVELNEVNYLELEITDSMYVMRVNDEVRHLSRYCSNDYKRYYLNPYFGGDETAPHDIKIKIKEI